MKHLLPKLDYAYDALEPFFDKETMLIHHSKHHQTYTDKFNAALEKYPELQVLDPEELLKNPAKLHVDIRQAVINHGGGYVNHNFFWKLLKKGINMSGKMSELLTKNFGSVDEFKKKFSDAALNKFGSGWAWLVENKDGSLEIISTSNQDSPLSLGKKPLLTIDVWEHSYYLKFQNKRADYINTFWNVVDWEQVERNLGQK